jgi:hypothetical protein
MQKKNKKKPPGKAAPAAEKSFASMYGAALSRQVTAELNPRGVAPKKKKPRA